MKETIQMRNLSPAQSVKRNLPMHGIRRIHMDEKPFSAQSVARNSAKQVLLVHMKESTLMRNHSTAPSVTIDAQHQAI